MKKAIAASKVATSDVAIAAVNGPKMTVISGRKEAVQKAKAGTGTKYQVFVECMIRQFVF